MEREKIIELVSQFLNQSNEKDREVLSSILNGLIAKQEGKYSTYWSSLMQIEGYFLENGDFEMKIPVQPIINNFLNMVHGGFIATLLDTTMGNLITKKLPKDLTCVTAEIKVNYLKPGTGTFLRCVAKDVHRGKHLCVAEAKVYSDQNQLIASASGTFFVIKRPTKGGV